MQTSHCLIKYFYSTRQFLPSTKWLCIHQKQQGRIWDLCISCFKRIIQGGLSCRSHFRHFRHFLQQDHCQPPKSPHKTHLLDRLEEDSPRLSVVDDILPGSLPQQTNGVLSTPQKEHLMVFWRSQQMDGYPKCDTPVETVVFTPPIPVMWHFIRCMVISWSSRNFLEKKVQMGLCITMYRLPAILLDRCNGCLIPQIFHWKPRPFAFFSMAKFWNLYIEFLLHANSLRISTICGRTVVKLKSPMVWLSSHILGKSFVNLLPSHTGGTSGKGLR